MRKKLDFKLKITDEYKYEILVDVTLNFIEYCLQKGFSLVQCVECLQLQHDLLEEIGSNSHVDSKTCLSKFIENLNVLYNDFSQIKIINLIEYMNSTVFTHFNLYKYVLTNERDSNIREEQRDFIGPEKRVYQEENPLREPKPYNIWEYEKKLNGLELQEKNFKQMHDTEQAKLIKSEQEMAKGLRKYIRQCDQSLKLDEEV